MNYKDVLRKFKESNADIKWYFQELPKLINKSFPYELCIAYLFMQLEMARMMTLYCCIKRKYRTDPEVTWRILDANEINWRNFEDYFYNIFNLNYDPSLFSCLSKAINARNKIMHGGSLSEEEKRNSICDVLEFSELYNDFIFRNAGFKPISKLTGVFGAQKYILDGEVTRLVMKGLGFLAQ